MQYIYVNISSIECVEKLDSISENDLYFKVIHKEIERKSKTYLNQNSAILKDQNFLFFNDGSSNTLTIELWESDLIVDTKIASVNIIVNDSLTQFSKLGIKGTCGFIYLQSQEENEFYKQRIIEITNENNKFKKILKDIKNNYNEKANEILEILYEMETSVNNKVNNIV